MYSIEEFKNHIKKQRLNIPKPEAILSDAFKELGYFDSSKTADFFINNASQIINETRAESYRKYLQNEREFGAQMMLDWILQRFY